MKWILLGILGSVSTAYANECGAYNFDGNPWAEVAGGFTSIAPDITDTVYDNSGNQISCDATHCNYSPIKDQVDPTAATDGLNQNINGPGNCAEGTDCWNNRLIFINECARGCAAAGAGSLQMHVGFYRADAGGNYRCYCLEEDRAINNRGSNQGWISAIREPCGPDCSDKTGDELCTCLEGQSVAYQTAGCCSKCEA